MVTKYIRPVRGNSQPYRFDTLSFCEKLLTSVGAPTSYVSRKLAAGDGNAIARNEFDPSLYGPLESDAFIREYFAYNLLRKFPSLPGVSTDTKSVALQKFFESETECKSTNERVPYFGFVDPNTNSDVNMVLYHARRKIQQVLGVFSWDTVMLHADFSNGASTRIPRRSATLHNKLHGALHLTAPLLPHFVAFSALKPGLFSKCEVVGGNKITTVPKDAKTDRCIAIEPDYNMFVQKAIGTTVRKLLKAKTKEQIDLNDQSHNQNLAYLASLGFGLATVDLSSASDTISTALVSNLLPIDWFEALDLCRSHYGTLPDGTTIPYEKFSSMGNGFTFELESLIFWALCQGVISVFGRGSEYVSVYGDDIVINSSLYDSLVSVFSYVGFTVNARKSFHRGLFYESCGKHYFAGRDVTPVYVDKVPQRIVERVALANELILFSSRLGCIGLFRDASLKHAIDSLISTLPAWLQSPRAPVSHKGSAIIGDFDECCPQRANRFSSWFCFDGLVETRRPVLLYKEWEERDKFIRASLFTLDYRSYGPGALSVKYATSQFGKLKRKRIIATEWSYLGPWITV